MKLPIPFIENMETLLGKEEWLKMREALTHTDSPISIRLNPKKMSYNSVALQSEVRVPWASQGVYLKARPAFIFDPLWHAGLYYVQEAASMFVEQAVQQFLPNEPVTVLDLCAAPGGKSTLLASFLPEGSCLVSNEVMKNRSAVLQENMTKWGYPDVIITRSDPADFSHCKECFDLILTDAPCSGEGMFRKDEKAVEDWSPENVQLCQARQRRILGDIWGTLKEGGLLIYSTCTYNTRENEENVAWLVEELGAEPLSLQINGEWSITSNLADNGFPVYRFLPHKTDGEGFFMALLRKPGEWESATLIGNNRKKAANKGKSTPVAFTKEMMGKAQKWVKGDGYQWLPEGTTLYCRSPRVQACLEQLGKEVYVLQAGVEVCTLKGKDLVPSQGLCQSLIFNDETFPKVELSYMDALMYLRKEAVVLPAGAPKGIVLLTYKGVPLGFVKNIGNRANNLYPQEWRIKTTYLPEEEVQVISI